VAQRLVEQALEFRITTDHSVESDDVGGRQLTGDVDEITLNESREIRLVPSRGLCRRCRDVRRRKINADRARQPPVQELERQRSDARADVEQPALKWAGLRKAGKEETRRRFRAFGAVSGELLRGLFRVELPFDRVADAGTATGHRHLPRIADKLTPMTP